MVVLENVEETVESPRSTMVSDATPVKVKHLSETKVAKFTSNKDGTPDTKKGRYFSPDFKRAAF